MAENTTNFYNFLETVELFCDILYFFNYAYQADITFEQDLIMLGGSLFIILSTQVHTTCVHIYFLFMQIFKLKLIIFNE